MRRSTDVIAADNNKGVEQIQKLKLKMAGEDGVKCVQRVFMELAEIRRKFRLSTKEKDIVKWLTVNITPEKTQTTVQNYLRQSEEGAQKASREVR